MTGPTLSDVEAALAGRRGRMRFDPALETAFESRIRSYRRKIIRDGVWRAVAIYNVFLVADWILVPEGFALATLLHFALVTPVILAVGQLYQRRDWPLANALLAASIPFLMVAQIMAIFALHDAPGREHYQYLAVMIVVYSNVNQRLGFPYAVMTTTALVTLYLGVLLPSAVPLDVKFVGASMAASAAYLTLSANWRMEQAMRRAFLHGLRDELLRKGAEKDAVHDPLTGLANRRRLDTFVAELWAAREAEGGQLAVVMADIDHFKAFNDTYGHQEGDLCLERVARALSAELGPRDLVVRYGGEEFLMLVPGLDHDGALRLADRLRRRIEALGIPHATGGACGHVTASFGVVAAGVPDHTPGELIAAADRALYRAKTGGRNLVRPLGAPLSEAGGAPRIRVAG